MPGKVIFRLAPRLLVGAGLALASPALLAHPHGPPPGAGNPHAHHPPHEKGTPSRRMSIWIRPGHYFTAGQREHVHAYFARGLGHGRCPPGLARKHDGCLPPGHARQWSLGKRLPSGVSTYPVSARVVGILGSPPAGYRYVRVATDILLVATGTRIVIDAINDLGHT